MTASQGAVGQIRPLPFKTSQVVAWARAEGFWPGEAIVACFRTTIARALCGEGASTSS